MSNLEFLRAQKKTYETEAFSCIAHMRKIVDTLEAAIGSDELPEWSTKKLAHFVVDLADAAGRLEITNKFIQMEARPKHKRVKVRRAT